jgi:hypothetical protein
MMMKRRTFLQVVAGGAALARFGALRALGAAPAASDDFFVFIHAAGGWDVTLWADPRNEKKGLVDPASTENTDVSGVKRWVNAPLEGDAQSFALVRPPGSKLVFGPGIGDLAELHDRLTIVNGLAMNTVSHPDGTCFSATGRHLQGGRAPAASIDTLVAHALGVEQLFPDVSVQFPSSFVGEQLDRRAIPLRVNNVGAIARSLARSELWDAGAERDQVTALLSEEAEELARRSSYPETMRQLEAQYQTLPRMLGGDLAAALTVKKLQEAHPELDYKAKFQAAGAVSAAFAIEAMKRNLVRCVSFALGGFDTHNGNYKFQARTQQEAFDLIAQLVRKLDATPHPTRDGRKLGDHAHLLVVSDFCRTPQINLSGGRDHYPNNSALVISPRFRGGAVFGKSDPAELLPSPTRKFSDGERPIAPPDLLATFLAAFGIEPRRWLRDGEVVPEMLA